MAALDPHDWKAFYTSKTAFNVNGSYYVFNPSPGVYHEKPYRFECLRSDDPTLLVLRLHIEGGTDHVHNAVFYYEEVSSSPGYTRVRMHYMNMVIDIPVT